MKTKFRLFGLLLFTLVVLNCAKEDVSALDENSSLNEQLATLILQKTNKIRTDQGLTALIQNDEMDALAKFHSDNMVKEGFFDHTDHEGNSPSDRADNAGYGWSRIAENIVYVPWFENVSGCGDTRSAEALSACMVEGWRNSPGHYANMIGDYVQLGVGVSFTQDSIAYATQVFRTP